MSRRSGLLEIHEMSRSKRALLASWLLSIALLSGCAGPNGDARGEGGDVDRVVAAAAGESITMAELEVAARGELPER